MLAAQEADNRTVSKRACLGNARKELAAFQCCKTPRCLELAINFAVVTHSSIQISTPDPNLAPAGYYWPFNQHSGRRITAAHRRDVDPSPNMSGQTNRAQGVHESHFAEEQAERSISLGV